MDLLAGYGDGDDSGSSPSRGAANDLDTAQNGQQPHDFEDSDEASEDSSVDTAAERAAAAAAKLRDFKSGEEASSARNVTAASNGRASMLPSPLAAFSEVGGRPAFLDPEATRPIAAVNHVAAHAQLPTAGELAASSGRQEPGEGFDISRLAPKVKGQQSGEKRSGAVIEGKAKRYQVEDQEGPIYTDAQVALMGGKVSEQQQRDAAPGAAPPPGDAGARKPSKAMGVSEFLDRGVGGAVMPRKAQDRKDKEKRKRSLGQSAIGSWKTEAEMVLRQQYDS